MNTALLVDVLLKGSAALALAALIVQGMRRTSAAARHLLWTCALVAALIIPLASITLPAWRVLPKWLNMEAVVSAPEKEKNLVPPTDATNAPTPQPSPPVAESSEAMSSQLIAPHLSPGVSVLPAPSPTGVAPDLPDSPAPIPSEVPGDTIPDSSSPSTSFPWVTLWLAGFLLMLLPLALSALSLFRLERRSQRITSGPLSSFVTGLCNELDFRRKVRLLMGANDAMPMVWGLNKSRLVLPGQTNTWPEETLRAVLLHELTHLKRRDPLTLFLSHLSLA